MYDAVNRTVSDKRGVNRRLRILAVDDEPTILETYEAVLTAELTDVSRPSTDQRLFKFPRNWVGMTVQLELCAEADAAINLVRKGLAANDPFAVVFMDIGMSAGPDGIWAAQRIRDLDPLVYIVFVTGCTDHSIGDVIHAVPPADRLRYLRKPFLMEEILDAAADLGTRWLEERGLAVSVKHGSITAVDGQDCEASDYIKDPIDFDRILVETNEALAQDGADFLEGAQIAFETAVRSFGAARAAFWLAQDDGEDFACVSVCGQVPPGAVRLAMDSRYMQALRAQRSLAIGAESYEPWAADWYRAVGVEGGLPSLHAAVRCRHEVAGILQVETRDANRSWTHADRGFIASLTDALALALERHEAAKKEENLLARLDFHLALMENTTDIVYVHRVNGPLISISPGAARLLGFSIEEMLAMTPTDLLTPGHRGFAREMIMRKVRGEIAPAVFEVDLVAKNGRRIPTEINSWPVVRNGKAVAIQGVARDITERRKGEECRAALEEQLRLSQRLEAVGRLAGGVAHDFNNILTAILGSGELMSSVMANDDPHRGNVDEILKAGQRAANLTRQLLAFSRKQILVPKVLNLNVVVIGLESFLRRVIGEDVELIIDVASDVGNIKADLGQIEQVIINLAVNARDAMPSGGRLRISTASDQPRSGDSGDPFVAGGGQYALLSVSDTGAGMDADLQDKIFEPFFTSKPHGTGLGLSTVYGIAKQSGGQIAVESAPGEGATFRVYFPTTQEALSKKVPAVARAESPTGTETILVAEDDCALRTLAKRILTRYGYTVLTAENGAEALALSQRTDNPIDLLLTDVVMPRMGGVELATEITVSRGDIRVLFMSGYTDETITDHIIEERAAGFLHKPFTPDLLLATVREILDEK
jgi:PAS domain S-box-containing protein